MVLRKQVVSFFLVISTIALCGASEPPKFVDFLQQVKSHPGLWNSVPGKYLGLSVGRLGFQKAAEQKCREILSTVDVKEVVVGSIPVDKTVRCVTTIIIGPSKKEFDEIENKRTYLIERDWDRYVQGWLDRAKDIVNEKYREEENDLKKTNIVLYKRIVYVGIDLPELNGKPAFWMKAANRLGVKGLLSRWSKGMRKRLYERESKWLRWLITMSYLLEAVIGQDQKWWEKTYFAGPKRIAVDYNARRPRYTFWSFGALSNLVENIGRIMVRRNKWNSSIRLFPFDVVSEKTKKMLFPEFFSQKIFISPEYRFNVISESDVRFAQAKKHGLKVESKALAGYGKKLYHFSSMNEQWYTVKEPNASDAVAAIKAIELGD